jgi:hypothetical protein
VVSSASTAASRGRRATWTTPPRCRTPAFTDDAGENYNISAAHVTPELARIYRDVRSFVDGRELPC